MATLDKSDIHALEARAGEVSSVLALMANPKRLLILCRLAEGETSVNALAEAVHLGQSALSQHLAKLRQAGLVATRREAQTIHYSLASEEVRAIMAALYDVFCREARGPGAQPDTANRSSKA